MRLPVLASSLAIACITSMASPVQAMNEIECQVFDQERAFAQSVAEHDAAAFANFLHPNTVFNMADPKPTHGKEAVVKAWSQLIVDTPVSLQWQPQIVNVSGDGQLANSSGPFLLEIRKEDGSVVRQIGRFMTIWQRSADGRWLVAMDGSATPPTLADEAQAKAHMDVPQQCVADSANQQG